MGKEQLEAKLAELVGLEQHMQEEVETYVRGALLQISGVQGQIQLLKEMIEGLPEEAPVEG